MNRAQRQVTNPADPQLVEELQQWRARIADELGEVAGQRFMDMMLDTWTTTMSEDDQGVFVITGDIPAMWLRDSSAQMLPFLRLAHLAPVDRVLRGVARRQWRCIALDPYANAFNATASGRHFDDDDLDLDPRVWERKYEIDSLAFAVDFAHRLWRATDNASHLDEEVHEGCRVIVDLWRTEQHHGERSTYRHIRPSEPVDTLPDEGRGAPVAHTGMTWSGFRPSDDANTFGYNIPAQFTAARALRQISEFAELWGDGSLGAAALALRTEILEGLERHAVVDGRLAYEVDGLGGRLFMDDANMPSLLSLPLTSDLAADDPLYARTRAWVLSPDNPFYFAGTHASGVGSPHTPPGYIWHIALAVQGLTGSRAEGLDALATILATDGGTGWTHEGFDPDDPAQFTRTWFSWSNSMACELMMKLASDG